MKNIGIVSGYFSPLRLGHIRLFEDASQRVDFLICILNNDSQAHLRRQKKFLPEALRIESFLHRYSVVESNRYIDLVVPSLDTMTDAVGNTLTSINDIFGYRDNFGGGANLYFFNGGHVKALALSELKICQSCGIEVVFNVGN